MLRQLAADDETPLRVIVIVHPSGEDPIGRLVRDRVADPVSARARYVQDKQQALSQALMPLAPMLREAEKRGTLVEQRELWLVDAIGLTAAPSLIRDLAASPVVAEIRLDHYQAYITPPRLGPADGISADARSTTPGGVDTAVEVSVVPTLPWGVGRIRAPEVWANLGITGTGAVVAIIDTGVDWLHPDLAGEYRGNLGKGRFDHSASWYDAVNGGIYPYDDYGHGSHVAGIAVGASVGVAPGARWIGVKVLDTDGYGYDSWILSGLQWLLAPGGDPGLAPDVVNGSWGNTNGYTTVFLAAIDALKAAGIFPVFAAGNAGPTSGSVSSPASNLGVFAVGASDVDEDIAAFSSRGPSPWGEIKPVVVAPGVGVWSAIPGGVYGEKNGTSMATPHVAGLAALMRAVSPTVSIRTMAFLITETAQPLTGTVPNYVSGWGRIDAYAALTALTHPAIVSGTVRGDQGELVAGARIMMQPDVVPPGGILPFVATSDAQGHYFFALQPGVYTLTVTAFGYFTMTLPRIEVAPATVSQVDVVLTAMPKGTLQGRISAGATGLPPSTTVAIRPLNTPVTTMPDIAGNYALVLPGGTYTVEVRALGYRVVTASLTIVPGQTVVRNFALATVPTLLLVDEGAWYYGSEISYWREALDGLSYPYDEVRIKTPGPDTPVSNTLRGYDIVLWSSPSGSPGLVGAGGALSDYLSGGGRLMLSGQDVAYFDGGGLSFWGYLESYLTDQMSTVFITEDDARPVVMGRGPFEGQTVSLEGGSGADNQVAPDVVKVADTERASPVWLYADGQTAGVGADICVPHRSLFFGFGYEAISDVDQQREVLQRSIDWLMTEPLTRGLTLDNVTDPVLIARPGAWVSHVVRVHHIGSAGVTETVSLAVQGDDWPAVVVPEEMELPPCASALVTVTVALPVDAGINAADVLTLEVKSTQAQVPMTISVTTKTPAPVLLVDDDRWYPVQDLYTEAMSAAHIPFDVWDTRSGLGGTPTAYSPLTATLTMYPVIVWFTGYDWYAPIVPEEAQRLLAYLDQGGRLLLSSQDFVYHHEDEPLTHRLGILFADWSEKAIEAMGVAGHPAGGAWGPSHLVFPFPNWSHIVEPAPDATPVARGQIGQPLGIAVGRPVPGASQTLFYALPLEALPLEPRAQALANGVGWLSPLGGTDWDVSSRAGPGGVTATFSLQLRNSWREALKVGVRHQVPDGFEVVSKSVPPGLAYDPTSRQLTWGDTVPSNALVELKWEAVWLGTVGQGMQPTVTLSLPDWGLSFVREAPFYGGRPDLGTSYWSSQSDTSVPVGEAVSLTFRLRNSSAVSLVNGSLSFWLMDGVTPISVTAPLTGGVRLEGQSVSLAPYEQLTITVPIRAWTVETPVRLDAQFSDGGDHRWERSLWLTAEPRRLYLPVIHRSR